MRTKQSTLGALRTSSCCSIDGGGGGAPPVINRRVLNFVFIAHEPCLPKRRMRRHGGLTERVECGLSAEWMNRLPALHALAVHATVAPRRATPGTPAACRGEAHANSGAL